MSQMARKVCRDTVRVLGHPAALAWLQLGLLQYGHVLRDLCLCFGGITEHDGCKVPGPGCAGQDHLLGCRWTRTCTTAHACTRSTCCASSRASCARSPGRWSSSATASTSPCRRSLSPSASLGAPASLHTLHAWLHCPRLLCPEVSCGITARSILPAVGRATHRLVKPLRCKTCVCSCIALLVAELPECLQSMQGAIQGT